MMLQSSLRVRPRSRKGHMGMRSGQAVRGAGEVWYSAMNSNTVSHTVLRRHVRRPRAYWPIHIRAPESCMEAAISSGCKQHRLLDLQLRLLAFRLQRPDFTTSFSAAVYSLGY